MAEKRRQTSRRERAAPPLDAKREVATVRCPFCHADVPQDALAAKCGKCQTVHHATCFDEKGGCSVDGCGGKGATVVKGWRAALGECRACRAKIYRDENVAVCAGCESIHHPSCLEARDGCAECGSGEGLLVAASVLGDGGASRWSSLPYVVFGLGVLSILLAWVTHEMRLVLASVLASVVLAPLAAVVGRQLDAMRRRRLLLSGEKVKPVKPQPPKAEG